MQRRHTPLTVGTLVLAALLAGCTTGVPHDEPQDGTHTTHAADPDAYTDLASTINGRSIEEFVTSECGSCHNPLRTGATGPDITQERLRNGKEGGLYPMTRDSVLITLQYGRPGTAMPAWDSDDNPVGKALTEAEMKAVVEHLFTTDPPERFTFTLEDMKATHEVLVPETAYPPAPTHPGRMDDLLLVTERENYTVAVIDGDTFEVLGHMPAGARAHGYTFHPDGRFAYNLGRDGWLFKYDLYTLEPVIKVRVGLDARGIAIDDEGKYLMIGDYIPAQAAILDATTLEPLKVFDTSAVEDMDGNIIQSRVATVNDVRPEVGPYFIFALKEAGQLWRVDHSDPSFPVDKTMQVGRILHDAFLSPDGTLFYIAAQESDYMAAVDTRTMEVVATIQTGKQPHPGSGAAWEADGRHYASTVHIGDAKNVVWDMETHEVVGEVPANSPGLFVRTTAKMEYVWFDSVYPPAADEIVVHEKSAPFNVVKVIADGSKTLHPEPDADGDYVFVSDWSEDVVRVYDDETLELVKVIEGLVTPTGIFSVDRIHEKEGH